MSKDRKVRMADVPQTPESERIRRERDLYLRLLDLGTRDELEPFLREALGLIVEVSGARGGYLELRVKDSDEPEPAWWMAHDCSTQQVESIRDAISRGIIAEALGSGRTVSTASALLDPRFADRASVKAKGIEAVLCAPIGGDASLGVVYLQGRGEPGPFTEDDRAQAELFARHLAPLAERLVVRERTRSEADPTLPLRRKLRLVGVVGRSEALARVLGQAALVAPVDVNVLLTGESGTGKNLLARVIHDNGPRAARPFVELNCAALPETLIESELFGARRGAHSTAQRSVEGKVGAAEGGTLFLDEIGEIPLTAQSKLLQLLQSKEYYPLGGSQPVRADVRVIAATNSDLAEAVRARSFREDLFYRLQILPIRLPSLAERRDDIADLARHFCSSAFDRHGLARLEPSPGALLALEAAEWPGNVRQLAHAIEAAVIRAAGEGARRVERRHVFPESAADATNGDEPLTFQEATRRFQHELVLKTLAETSWNVAETARRLDLARSHVYNLIKAFGLERESESALADHPIHEIEHCLVEGRVPRLATCSSVNCAFEPLTPLLASIRPVVTSGYSRTNWSAIRPPMEYPRMLGSENTPHQEAHRRRKSYIGRRRDAAAAQREEQCMIRRTLFIIAAWCFASPCTASQLLVSSTSARDTALSGSTVAEPRTPSAAMFSNPAGLVLFDETTVEGTTAFAFANPRVDVSAPSTYDETSSVFVLSPAMGVALPSKGSWHFGFALYGSVGNKFDFGADPSEGVPDDFFSEAGVFTFGAGVAYRFGDRLSLGAAITPLFGLLTHALYARRASFQVPAQRARNPGHARSALGASSRPCRGSRRAHSRKGVDGWRACRSEEATRTSTWS